MKALVISTCQQEKLIQNETEPYRSSLAKQALASGQPISTPSHCSHSSSDLPLNHVLQEKSDRQGSVISDIHHLTNSPNTFETSITSNSSLSSASNRINVPCSDSSQG
ncbi:unnamed protein product [Adineta ricciae]|uniref:Uncharacterized protein n=1 Tax=Adineta ricciae TaxID=249248 RepID=A0A814VFG2_ADIRI|nr:unnamed protein product [Adineta ricciae]